MFDNLSAPAMREKASKGQKFLFYATYGEQIKKIDQAADAGRFCITFKPEEVDHEFLMWLLREKYDIYVSTTSCHYMKWTQYEPWDNPIVEYIIKW